MSRRVSLVVLCEDEQHHSFAAAFLKRVNLPYRVQPRFRVCGSKASVKDAFPTEVSALLRQGGETHLFVLLDADGDTSAQNKRALLDSLDEGTREKLQRNGRWLALFPNWEIENWIRHLEGQKVTEERTPGFALKHQSDCRQAARGLADDCRERRALTDPPPSLAEACAEWHSYASRHDL